MKANNSFWIYGKHAALAAINNPKRIIEKIIVTKNNIDLVKGKEFEILDSNRINSIIPNVVHQGVAVKVKPQNVDISEVMDSKTLLILDQVTDVQNIGAILRSAAAFDVGAVIIPKNNNAGECGAMAKSAVGAMESVPLISVTNLASEIKYLKKNNYFVVGLSGYAKNGYTSIDKSGKNIIILGSESKGMRRLTEENCDIITKIPMSSKIESLNVSNAAAIILSHFYQG